MRAWLLALLVLAPALASLAAAQGPGTFASLTVAVEDPGRAFSPGRNESLNVLINYNVHPGGAPAPGPNPTEEGNETQPTRVTLSAKAIPSWVENVTFDPPVVEIKIPFGHVSGTIPALATAIVLVKPDAPALQREEFVVEAVAAQNGNLQEARAESAAIKLRAAFVARVNVTTEPSIIVPGGRWTDITFHVVNQGNAETKVELNVTARPQESEVDYPKSVTLPVRGAQDVVVRLRLPWTYAEGGIVELEAIPLTDDDEGKPARAETEIFGQSAVPAPPLAVALALVAGLALSRRRA